jgi:hypothetical protein
MNNYSYTVYPKNQDLSKTWFVQYTNPTGGKPLKKYGSLSKLPYNFRTRAGS